MCPFPQLFLIRNLGAILGLSESDPLILKNVHQITLKVNIELKGIELKKKCED